MARSVFIFAAAATLAGCGFDPEAPPIESGAELYTYHCSACHGTRGEGDGPIAAVMNVSVPNLRSLSARNAGVFPAEAVAGFIDGRNLPVAHGDRYMPVWGDVFSWPEALAADAEDRDEDLVQRRIGALVTFLESIQDG